MSLGIGFFIVAALIAGIWIFIEFKRMRHKIFAFFLMGLILFTYISFSVVVKNHEVDFKTFTGWVSAGKLYFSWLFSVFDNAKYLTAQAIKLDWNSANDTISSSGG